MSIRGETQFDTFQFSDLERIGEHIPGGFFVYRADEAQEMLYVNGNVLRIFGCETLEEYKELTGYTFRGLVHPEDFEKIQGSIDEQIADSANDNLDYVEYRIVRKDGEVRWVDDYGRFVHLPGFGDVYYVFITDITDKRRAQEDRFQSELELAREKRANEIKSSLLLGITHDIRIPMDSIAEFTAQARRHAEEPHELRSDLEKIDSAGRSLSELINSLLKVSTVEYGRIELKAEPCSLREQAAETLALFRSQAERKGVMLKDAIDLPEESVLADAQRLRSVLGNLLSNAIQFTPRGGTVQMSACKKQASETGYAQYEFMVSDTGAGMTPEILQRVSQPSGEGGDDPETAQGGLAVTKRLLGMMGGSLTLESAPGKGTTAAVNLPLKLAMHDRNNQFSCLFGVFSLLAGDSPIYLYDIKTQAALFSPALADLVALADSRASGGVYQWADHIHPDDRERFARTMWEACDLKRASFDMRCRLQLRDGAYHTARFLGAATMDLDGNPNYLGMLLECGDFCELIDPVTGLRNRDAFFAELQKPCGADQSILMARLAGIGKISEEHGYGLAAAILRRAGRRIRDELGASGSIFRLSETEFALCSAQLGEAELRGLYESFRREALLAAETNGAGYDLSPAGALLFRPAGSDMNEKEVFEQLVCACNVSERERHGALVLFREDAANLSHRYAVIRRIRESMAQEFANFYLLYQPIYDSGCGKPVGAETLLRWKSGDLGEVLPPVFLPEIQQDEGYAEFAYWILRNAMEDAAAFLGRAPGFSLCVNVSPGQAADAHFAERLSATARQTGFPLERLYLDLNSDCRLLSMDTLRASTAALRALGAHVGLDSFGSGPAWFEALRELHADYVKFSGEFTRDAARSETGRNALRLLSELARTYQADVYVKSVETREMADALQDLPICGAQGQYYSEALYFDDLLELLGAAD